MTIYLAWETYAGEYAIFSSEEKRKDFLKKYACWAIDTMGEFDLDDEFHLETLEVDPNFDEWIKANG